MSRLTEHSLSVLVKLGSLAVHADEFLNEATTATEQLADRTAMQSLVSDPEVQEFIKQMGAAGYMPPKRSARLHDPQ